MEMYCQSSEWKDNGLGWKCWVCGAEFGDVDNKGYVKKTKQEFCSISCYLDWKQAMDEQMKEYLRKTAEWMKGGNEK